MKSKVSVIIPYYNYADYINEAIESVRAQTFINWDIVICNDCSSVQDTKFINALCSSDERITVIEHNSTLGASAARNSAVSVATGEFILPLDADDTLCPDTIECYLDIFKKDSRDFIYGYAQYFGTMTQINEHQPFTLAKLKQHNIVPITTLFEKQMWADVGGFDTNLKAFEDWEFWLHAALIGYRGFRINQVTFNYRRKTNSLWEREQTDYSKYEEYIRNKHGI